MVWFDYVINLVKLIWLLFEIDLLNVNEDFVNGLIKSFVVLYKKLVNVELFVFN